MKTALFPVSLTSTVSILYRRRGLRSNASGKAGGLSQLPHLAAGSASMLALGSSSTNPDLIKACTDPHTEALSAKSSPTAQHQLIHQGVQHSSSSSSSADLQKQPQQQADLKVRLQQQKAAHCMLYERVVVGRQKGLLLSSMCFSCWCGLLDISMQTGINQEGSCVSCAAASCADHACAPSIKPASIRKLKPYTLCVNQGCCSIACFDLGQVGLGSTCMHENRHTYVASFTGKRVFANDKSSVGQGLLSHQ